MARSNNVRGPTSALTEFLKESGITPTTIARRVRTRQVEQPAPVAGPSRQAENDESAEADVAENDEPVEREYNSDNLDEDDEVPLKKKRKLTKAAEAKLKAQAKAKAKKGKKKDDDDYSDDGSDEEDAYTALSKMWKDETKPPNGSLIECSKCGNEFSVTQYTRQAPNGGWLCHSCLKASGVDPFKKPAAPRKRKPLTEKRNVTHFEEHRLPSLANMCIKVVSSHIDDVEALGDIGSMNLDSIAKAIAKDRSLTPENATLFYDVQNTNLTLYDATNLTPPSLCALASLNPNLTTLRLDFCGRMDNSVLAAWNKSLPALTRIELLGPFLVHASTWQSFFESHPKLTGFLITQSPRFDVKCIESLVENCEGLTELRLKEVGKLADDFLPHIKKLAGQLTYLDLSSPGEPEAVSNDALTDLLTAVGAGLRHLDLSGHALLGDGFLFQGLKPHTRQLESLALALTPELTDAGVAEFFATWAGAAAPPNPPLRHAALGRNPELGGAALAALLAHSGAALESVDVNGWKAAPEDVLNTLGARAPRLRRVDVGWCREASDWTVKALVEGCPDLVEVKVWGCQRVTANCPRKRGVAVVGIEAQNFV
ncbi:RNI-like protein [Phanerochaete sordida]|uniref:RNI-like protein n=1 Tax=Phanerochaete sordida TaxID=48140 RepID=A0A9P3G962_9APHY|nr:RNI-like protein [Phanerochaete sordida]